ncbi:CvpA family protein [Staphylococcus saccharolyticus]|uniref:CvpA family protein n=1 Tax=Staphylococcus saccharolyticus TaxID=33028 RepID=UPI0032DEB721
MLIDFIVLIIFGYFMMIGFRRGFWLSTLHSTSTIVSLWIASQFYVAIAQRLIVFLPFPKTVAYDTNYAIQYDYLQLRFEKIIGFVVIAIICKLILYLVIVSFDNTVAYKKIHLVSRIGGVILGLVIAVVIIQIGLYALSLYPHTFIQNQFMQSFISKRIIIGTPIISHFILNL